MAESGNDSVWKKILEQVKKLERDPHVKVGVFGDATKATAHEFGVPSINLPERSVIRLTFQKNEKELEQLTAKVAEKILTKGLAVEKGLAIIGQWGANECKNTIKSQPDEWPPLSEAYEVRKHARGKTKILIDTGELIASYTYEVDA